MFITKKKLTKVLVDIYEKSKSGYSGGVETERQNDFYWTCGNALISMA